MGLGLGAPAPSQPSQPPQYTIMFAGAPRTGKSALARLILDTTTLAPAPTRAHAKKQAKQLARFVAATSRPTRCVRTCAVDALRATFAIGPSSFSVASVNAKGDDVCTAPGTGTAPAAGGAGGGGSSSSSSTSGRVTTGSAEIEGEAQAEAEAGDRRKDGTNTNTKSNSSTARNTDNNINGILEADANTGDVLRLSLIDTPPLDFTGGHTALNESLNDLLRIVEAQFDESDRDVSHFSILALLGSRFSLLFPPLFHFAFLYFILFETKRGCSNVLLSRRRRQEVTHDSGMDCHRPDDPS